MSTARAFLLSLGVVVVVFAVTVYLTAWSASATVAVPMSGDYPVTMTGPKTPAQPNGIQRIALYMCPLH